MSYPAYQDNARYLYDYVISNRLHIKYDFTPIWVTMKPHEEGILRSKGINAYYKYRIRGIQYLLSSKVFLFTHLPTDYRSSIIKGHDTKTIFLNHGIPLKGSPYKPNYIARYMMDIDYIVSTSTLASFISGGWLGVHYSKFVVTGYPRNDALLKPYARDRAEKLLRKLKILNDEAKEVKVVLYVPTYRYYYDVKRSKLSIEGKGFKNILPLKDENIKYLNNILKRENAILIIRYHPLEEYYRMNILKMLKHVETYSNIKILTTEMLLTNDITIYDILPRVDILITDYSSIFYDYLLLNKPIIFYHYDVGEYWHKRNAITEVSNFSYLLPGTIAFTQDEFLHALNDVLKGNDQHAMERVKLMDLIHYYKDDHSSERVWYRLMKPFID